ncbi:EAL domain-containing protein [Salmonella enterica subsp. enterica]
MGIVAEGVETQEQCDYLAAQGVDFLQGYLFGRPEPFDAFIKSLRRD